MNQRNSKRSFLAALKVPILISGLAVSGAYVLVRTQPQLEPINIAERAWPVKTIVAKRRTVRPKISLFGEIVAARKTELRPAVDGLIVDVDPALREGGSVIKGQQLLRIDPFVYKADLKEQKTALQEAKIKFELLLRELARVNALFEERNVSEQHIDDKKIKINEQQALIDQLRIRVSRAQRVLDDTHLVAPFDGVLNKVNVALGKQYSNRGAEMVAELIDTSRFDVRFSLTHSQFGRLRQGEKSIIGRPVQVLWKVGEERLTYAAVIERIGAEIASETGGIDIYAVIQSEGEQTELRPGAFVSISLQDREYIDVFMVPATALYGADTIYLVEGEKLVSRRIKIHGYAGSNILFTGKKEQQVQSGDLIVITKFHEAGVGTRVKVL